MDFSDSIPCTAHPQFSPDKKYVATALGYRLAVRHCETLSVVQVFSCLDRIDEISWSPNSDHILCGLYSRATVQVFSVSDPEWTCSIAEGPAGIVAARWAPGGQHILLTADYQVKLAVWSLVDQTCTNLRGPKFSHDGLHFSPDGTLLAVAGFGVVTQDLADLAWSPDGSCFAVWDCPAYGYKVAVYTPEGECLTSSVAYTHGLGVKSVAWSPSGQLLAVGSYDQDVRVLNHVTWNPLAHFLHSPGISGPASVVVYNEVEEDTGRRVSSDQENMGAQQHAVPKLSTRGAPLSARGSGPSGGARSGSLTARNRAGGKPVSRQSSPVKGAAGGAGEGDTPSTGELAITKSRYMVAELPVKLQVLRAPPDKPNPKLGVGTVSWSADGSYVVTRCDNMPTSLWVWDTSRLELAAVLTQAQPIKCAEWDPVGNRLAVCCGGTKVFVWTPEGASCVHIPLPDFRAWSLRWHPGGSFIMLSDRTAVCCAYLE